MLIRIKMIRSSTKMTAEYSASQTFYCIYRNTEFHVCYVSYICSSMSVFTQKTASTQNASLILSLLLHYYVT